MAALRVARSFGSHTAETTFYPQLSNLLNAVGERLNPRVIFVAHPGNRGAGLPDGGFFPVAKRSQAQPVPSQRPERGVAEIKAPGESLAALARSEQVMRYLREYGLCLITNYHQFALVEIRHEQAVVTESYNLTPTADDLWQLPVEALSKRHRETLPDFLARVLTRKVPLAKPKDVAELLASYAREARERAADHPLAAFAGVKSAIEDSLGITFEGEKGEHFFRSTLVQTLFYGMFSAWILWRRTDEGRAEGAVFNWRLSAYYLRIPVLSSLFQAISDPGAINSVQIAEVLDHAGEALNRVEPVFFTSFREEDAVNYFYEPFLQAFDPELRKQLGVWYTPREIVRYMVERVDHLLRTELNEPLGLASTNVQVLDPCCGTGAYLVEVLHRVERTLREHASDDDNYVGSDLRRAATTRIFGFEIMPAPFVIAHLQIARLLEDVGASLTQEQRAQVFLTNALTGWVPVRHPQSRFGFPAFAEERDAAERVKQADTILVILGNPPYNGYAGIAQIEEERGLTTAYREQVSGLTAPQGQGLNDLYIRFFRIAERRIVGDATVRGNPQGRGLVSFISNNAWLDGLSHVSMRARYLNEFQNIYIDNLNGDKYRTGKTTPEGKPDPSAFSTPQNREGIQVGTAIATLVRTSTAASANGIGLRDLWGTHKLSHLDREARREVEPAYGSLQPSRALGLPFAVRVVSGSYGEWPRLPELFPQSFPGIKTSRDSLLTDIDLSRLVKKMSRYLDPAITDSQIATEMPVALQDAAGFAAADTRNVLIRDVATALDGLSAPEKNAYLDSWAEYHIVPYYYRPFDQRWLFWESKTKLLDRSREGYYFARHPNTLELISSQANRRFYDPPCVTKAFVNLHVVERGATTFPLETINLQPLRIDKTEQNISREAWSWLQHFNVRSDELFFHALTIMHTPRYRVENAGALLGDWPRIPLPATAELLTHSASLGRRLAELLDPESDLTLAGEWSFLARLSLPPELPEGTADRDRRNAARLAITAGWGGRGQGDTVMPRRGDARERDWTGLEQERIAALAAAQGLTVKQALELLGTRCVDVYLNGAAFWAAVPLRVWEYTLGGYQVLKKWLSYREEPLLGRPLHEDEARYFAQVVRRIAAILLLGPALDSSYAAILPTAIGLPS